MQCYLTTITTIGALATTKATTAATAASDSRGHELLHYDTNANYLNNNPNPDYGV